MPSQKENVLDQLRREKAAEGVVVRIEPDRWQFAHLVPEDGGWVTRDLTEDSFWQAIGELIS